jgi:ribonuclease HI
VKSFSKVQSFKSMSKCGFYAVLVGRKVGVFSSWDSCLEQISGFPRASFKKFQTQIEADEFINGGVQISFEKIGVKRKRTKSVETDNNKSHSNITPFYTTLSKSGFGTAGKRTKSQSNAALCEAENLLRSFPKNSIIIFTDGACKKNPGPCGAGVAVYMPSSLTGVHQDIELWHGEPTFERSISLGMTGTNNVGELYAVGLAMDTLKESFCAGYNVHTCPIHVITDSKYTFGILSGDYKAKKNKTLVESVKCKLHERKKTNLLEALENCVDLHWAAGHVGLNGNERADKLANDGVNQSIIENLTLDWSI